MDPFVYLEEPHPLTELPPLGGNLGSFTHYVGYSVLGHVLIANPESGEFGVHYPLQNGFKSYGSMPREQFQRQVLDDPGFRDFAVPADHIARVAAHAGPLDPGQVYMPVPYPFLGGSGAPETYDRGHFGVFISLVSQMQGMR